MEAALVGLAERVATSAVGAFVAQFLAPGARCHCICESQSSPVLDILERQLQRCGPENLARHCPEHFWNGSLVGAAVVAAFVFGIICGRRSFSSKGERASPTIGHTKEGNRSEVDRGEAQARLRALRG